MILVTGGTGQTGQFVIQELRRRGRALRVLARPHSAAQVSEPGVEVALGDLADRDSLRRAIAGVSGVVHTACTFATLEIRTRSKAIRTEERKYMTAMDTQLQVAEH